MANNPYVNKVQKADGTTIIDITPTTATASDVSQGKYFFTASGELTLGTLSGGGGTAIIRDTTDSAGGTIREITTDEELYKIITNVFDDTTIRTDFTTDVTGVEYASILKNIYAIVIGMIDANFDSANLRSIFITKALNEMRRLIITFGGENSTMYHYCGFGDFSLTALNDMSRNRTLGLLIGKGFFNNCMSDNVVLEGRIAVDVFYKKLIDTQIDTNDYPLMCELYKVLNDPNYPTRNFIKNILKN